MCALALRECDTPGSEVSEPNLRFVCVAACVVAGCDNRRQLGILKSLSP